MLPVRNEKNEEREIHERRVAQIDTPEGGGRGDVQDRGKKRKRAHHHGVVPEPKVRLVQILRNEKKSDRIVNSRVDEPVARVEEADPRPKGAIDPVEVSAVSLVLAEHGELGGHQRLRQSPNERTDADPDHGEQRTGSTDRRLEPKRSANRIEKNNQGQMRPPESSSRRSVDLGLRSLALRHRGFDVF
eukprot:Amastigsp_a499_268.p4 type:complete len:188 gc:universal Amastigsp_a499_268:874-1437(+)